MDATEILAHVAKRLPGFTPRGAPIPLKGGLVNRVWRLEGDPRPIVVKHALPFLAAKPEIPSDPRRVLFEARSLRALTRGGELDGVASAEARPPLLFDVDLRSHTLLLEDVGALPDFGAHLAEGKASMHLGTILGKFIGSLHAKSFQRANLTRRFDNLNAQKTRRQVQYLAIGDFCRRARLADAGQIGKRAAGLGDRLMLKGMCVIMGDLWPPSILIHGDAVRVIDWELAHYGNPAQDVAHLAAHLWMHAQRAGGDAAQVLAQVALQSFFDA
jgi:5-methylthioribose kinase